MAPTSRTERRRWNSKGDTEDQIGHGTTNVQESVSDFDLDGELLRRTLSEILGRHEDEDEDEDEDGRGDVHSDLGLPPPHSLPLPSLPQLPPLQLLPNPLWGLLPIPKTDPPAAAPPPQPPLSASIPPQESVTDISGNFESASPFINPRRTTLSAALPKSTGSGDDSDDDDDDDDGDTSSTPSPTRSILSLTPAIQPPYETQSTEGDGQRSSISRTKSTLTTSAVLPVKTLEATRTETTMTSIPSPSGVVAMDQEREAARTSKLSPGGEKAVIAFATIGGFIILFVLAWFLWRRSSRRKAAGRKSTWPTNLPSREIFEGPRRVSSKVGEKFTSMKGHFRRPSALGWCSIGDDDDGALEDEKSAAPVAANAGGLLERRLGTSTPPQRVTVNSYGVIFRKPKRDSSLSDIFLPAGLRRTSPPSSSEGVRQSVSPPSSPGGVRIPIVRPNTQMAAAAHLENARKSMNAGAHNTPRTPRTPKTPLRRNTRMSDVSSLSSGFGDGDIVIIQPPTAAIAVKTANPSVIDSHVNLAAVRGSPERKRFSSRFSRNRDTVLTNASEDLRPRFRSISSWVGQQSRRAKRAAASEDEDGVPDVPDILPEQGFDMMMPDGQEPRRVDSSMWKKK